MLNKFSSVRKREGRFYFRMCGKFEIQLERLLKASGPSVIIARIINA